MTDSPRSDTAQPTVKPEKAVHQEQTQNKMLQPKADKAVRAPETKG